MAAQIECQTVPDEQAQRAEAIAEGAETVAAVVAGLAALVREHAAEIAGWSLRFRRNVRS